MYPGRRVLLQILPPPWHKQDVAVLKALTHNVKEHIKLKLNGKPGSMHKDNGAAATGVLGRLDTLALVYQLVGLVVRQLPLHVTMGPATVNASWTKEEMLEEAAKMVESELWTLLEKNIMDHVIGPLECRSTDR
ncbi:hypothetical protein CONPUDRAFT_72360 [Coniophora puteana RWD-64-598 SS2]|uniref:Uncharacterized protein n=1 Tax=Coniophora puteana (strain RWD-64-598) TaxID=741705 RepID=A0A5M3MTM8_CONPW|nr:uncharacterized protein CONPUDRAFT_72360 [Coniophora puteana RWD-64-598 SS2]EIW82025.1 hypothetical protein CONPUDRAFT_72360 [Coniophora puteana RWD-64-598 SS2]